VLDGVFLQDVYSHVSFIRSYDPMWHSYPNKAASLPIVTSNLKFLNPSFQLFLYF
jgi:hypothetical protein